MGSVCGDVWEVCVVDVCGNVWGVYVVDVCGECVVMCGECMWWMCVSLGARPSKNRKGGSGTSAGVEVYTAEC